MLCKSKFVLIDLGSMGILDVELRKIYLGYINVLLEGDFFRVFDYYIWFGVDVLKVNIFRVRVEMVCGFDFWLVKFEFKGLLYWEKFLGGVI